jgi:magnesium transporter
MAGLIDSQIAPADGSGGRIETLEHEGVTWTMVERPGPEQLRLLQERYDFHQLDLDDLVSKTERPKLEIRQHYLFAVLHFPTLVGRPRRLVAGELHVFLGQSFLVVVHDGDLRAPVRLFDELNATPEDRTAVMASPGHLFYDIVMRLIEATRPWCDRLPGAVDALQDKIFVDADLDTVRQLALLRREVIQLRRMIQPDSLVLAQLAEKPWVAGDLGLYWRNALDQIGFLVDYLDDLWNSLQALSQTYDQLAAHRVNNIMRLLTAISTIMLPLAVISGIYGMNVKGLPFAENEWAFELTLGLMLAVAVGLLLLFRRRRWL